MFTFNLKALSYRCLCIIQCSSPIFLGAVLQISEGLVAVQCIFLPAVGLHCYFLHPDDLRDAEEEEWCPDRAQ